MRQDNDEIEKYRVKTGRLASDSRYGNNGAFRVSSPWGKLFCIASDGLNDPKHRGGFEHVSVSTHKQEKCPTWEMMCFVKDLFWGEEETVIQYHPPKSEYVNFHPFVLHLWKPVGVDIETPPMYLIGPKG